MLGRKTNIYALQVHRMALKTKNLCCCCLCDGGGKCSAVKQRRGQGIDFIVRVGKSPRCSDFPFTHPFADHLLCLLVRQTTREVLLPRVGPCICFIFHFLM